MPRPFAAISTITPGKSFSSADIDEAVKRLFATGLFSDVRINQVGLDAGRPGRRIFRSSTRFCSRATRSSRTPQLAACRAAASRAARSRRTRWRPTSRRSRQPTAASAATTPTVTTQIMDLGENRVNVVFEINEGGRTKIAAINFVGNNAYQRPPPRARSSRPSARTSCPSSCATTSMTRIGCAPTRKRCAASTTITAMPISGSISAFGELDDVDQRIHDHHHRRGRRALHVRRRQHREHDRRRHRRSRCSRWSRPTQGDVYSAKNVEDTIIALTEKVAGMGYAFAQVTPRGDRNFENRTISVVYTIDQGAKHLCRAHRNPRQRAHARLRHPPRIRRQRRRRLQPGADPARQAAPRSARLLRHGRDLDRAGLASPTRSFWSSMSSRSRPASSRSAPATRPAARRPVRRSKARSPSATSSAAASSSASRPAAARIRATSRCPSPSPISSGGALLPASTSSGRRAPTTTTRARRPAARSVSACRSPTVAVDPDRLQSVAGKVRIRRRLRPRHGVLDPSKCNVSLAIQDGVNHSPWIKSSVSGSLIYNTIDDMKNPHAGIYAHAVRRSARASAATPSSSRSPVRARYYQTLSEELDVVGLLTGGAGHIDGFGADGLRIFDQFQSSDRMIRGFEYQRHRSGRRSDRRAARRHDLFQRQRRSAVPAAGRAGELRPARRGVCRCARRFTGTMSRRTFRA